MRGIKTWLPYLGVVIGAYLIPALAAPFQDPTGTEAKDLAFTSLLFINPLVTMGAAGAYAFIRRTDPVLPVAMAALFVPVAFIPPMNSSALVYAAIYLVTAGVGLGFGHLCARLVRTPSPA